MGKVDGLVGWPPFTPAERASTGPHQRHYPATLPCHACYYLSSISFTVSNTHAFASCLPNLVFPSTTSTESNHTHNGPRAQVRRSSMAEVFPKRPHHRAL